MPTDEQAVAQRRTLRLAFGTAACLCFSQAVAWPMSYIAAVITMTLLALPLPRPSAKFCLIVVLALVVPVFAALGLLPVLLHQQLAGIVLLTVALFHGFYFSAKGGPEVVATLITIALTIVVAVGTVSVDAVLMAAYGLSAGAAVGVLFVWLAHAVLPDVAQTPAQKPPAQPVAPEIARGLAVRSLSIVLPVTIWFMLSPSSASNAGVMIKVASMGQQAFTGGTRAAARSLILSTLMGGLAALVAWQLLSIWPSLLVYTLSVAVGGLLFGRRVFEGSGLASEGATWSYAYLTMLIVLGPSVLDGQTGAAAGAQFLDRLLMFIWATAYAVTAVFVLDVLWPRPAIRRALPRLPDEPVKHA